MIAAASAPNVMSRAAPDLQISRSGMNGFGNKLNGFSRMAFGGQYVGGTAMSFREATSHFTARAAVSDQNEGIPEIAFEESLTASVASSMLQLAIDSHDPRSLIRGSPQ